MNLHLVLPTAGSYIIVVKARLIARQTLHFEDVFQVRRLRDGALPLPRPAAGGRCG